MAGAVLSFDQVAVNAPPSNDHLLCQTHHCQAVLLLMKCPRIVTLCLLLTRLRFTTGLNGKKALALAVQRA